jgi:glutamate--cysteine ligase
MPFEHYRALLATPAANQTLTGILRGLEKESLRITPAGTLAQTDHPAALGSALKHPHITTDYSEALLEFITEPFAHIDSLLQQLDNIHRVTYQQLAQQNERLWPASMPCKLGSDAEIPVARYGSSNSGTMKTIYRVGLGHRYGRAMQTIAGVHYNFSFPDALWEVLRADEGSTETLQDFKTRRYFGLIRNFRHYFWLLVYLFGAAPAVCASFVEGRKHRLQPLGEDARTMHMPYATSLRMGDLGYQSDAQQALIVCYNNLPSYLQTLCGAITQTHPAYAAVGVKDDAGNYQQLNTSLLQIENEFYSSIRPKRTTQSGETALQALRLRGVEYVEVRCVDLNPYAPLGVTEEQLRTMDAFLLFCLLQDSPETSDRDYQQDQENQKRIVYYGRDPQLQLVRDGKEIAMSVWAEELLAKTTVCAGLLDQAVAGEAGTASSDSYTRAVQTQRLKLSQPELTPSAQVLTDLRTSGQSFFEHTMALAEQHRAYFNERPPSASTQTQFEQLAAVSLQRQAALEAQEHLPFEDYLANYYAQYQCCGCADNAPSAEAMATTAAGAAVGTTVE